MKTIRYSSFASIVMLALAGLASISPATAVAETPTYTLGVGNHAFWDGDYVDTSTGDGCDNCEWKLALADGGARLRVALDLILDYRRDAAGNVSGENEGVHPDASEGRRFKLEIFDGEPSESTLIFSGSTLIFSGSTEQGYSIELFLCFNKQPGEPCIPFRFDNGLPCDQNAAYNCEALAGRSKALTRSSGGVYTVRVTPDGDAWGWRFAMRAKLESAPPTPSNAPQLPNLRAIPPSELTFCEPKIAVGFFAGSMPVCGSESNGLTDQEEADLIAEEAETGSIKPLHRALRFSIGPENVGDGFLELRTHPEDPRNLPTRRIAFQRIYYPDGTAVTPDREVGTLEWHESHLHWHFQFFRYELYEVTRVHPNKPWKKIKLGERSFGNKIGFCPSDDKLADWHRFYQLSLDKWVDDRVEEDGPEAGIGCSSINRVIMGMTPGWSDLYEWARVEQFVEFPINADGSPRAGHYLLRATVDATLEGPGPLAESNENDNTSYAFFKVADGRIVLIKSDYGPGL